MKSIALPEAGREALLASLAEMPGRLERTLGRLSSEEARAPGPDDAFSPVEHAWHLADLEIEGFGERIRRLLAENEPWLPDFDGARIAAERDYRSLSLHDGLQAFAAARAHNLSILRALDGEAWMRRGVQEGVGPVMLCDLPDLMRRHDATHVQELEDWLRSRRT